MIEGLTVSLGGSQVGQVTQVGIFSTFAAVLGVFGIQKFIRNLKIGQEHVAGKPIVLHLGEYLGEILQGLGPVCEAMPHLFLGRQVELAVGESVAESAPAPDGS